MKALLTLLSLVSLSALASPAMEQVDHTERKGIKLDMATVTHPSEVMHQHKDTSDTPKVAVSDKEASKPRKQPSQANKKGRLHQN